LWRAARVDLAPVELGTLLFVREQLIGGRRLLEPLLGFLVAGMQIGVRRLGQRAIGAADLIRGRVSGDAKHLVGIAHPYLATRTAPALPCHGVGGNRLVNVGCLSWIATMSQSDGHRP